MPRSSDHLAGSPETSSAELQALSASSPIARSSHGHQTNPASPRGIGSGLLRRRGHKECGTEQWELEIADRKRNAPRPPLVFQDSPEISGLDITLIENIRLGNRNIRFVRSRFDIRAELNQHDLVRWIDLAIEKPRHMSGNAWPESFIPLRLGASPQIFDISPFDIAPQSQVPPFWERSRPSYGDRL